MHVTLTHKSLPVVFVTCLVLTLTIPVLAPWARLNFFAPFLVIACYQMSLPAVLWCAFGCGCVIDLFSADTRPGMYALNFYVATAILYPQRRHFFADSLTTLPIMTYLFSLISTITFSIAYYVIEMRGLVSLAWVCIDLIFMPGLDALYAFTLFILPPVLSGKRQLKGADYFLTRE